jgi:hypothetical protein
MSAPPDLKRLAVGERLQGPLLVLGVDRRDASRGPFTLLTLGNCHGQLSTSPFWAEDQPRIGGISPGDVAQVIGEVAQYNGRPQLKIASITAKTIWQLDRRRAYRGSSNWGPGPTG